MGDVHTKVKMESAVGRDYTALAKALEEKDFEQADDITRKALIDLAGPEAVRRGYVYFTEVASIPTADLVTIDRLWDAASDGKFGYALQSKLWRSKRVGQDFTAFSDQVGWRVEDEGVMRKRRWYGNNEFMYTLEEAPKGHLPLTNGLRGLGLFKELMDHAAWKSILDV